MKEELINRTLQLQTEVGNNTNEINDLKEQNKKLTEEKQEIERNKNEEIKELRRRIEEMSNQFAE